MKKTLIPSFFVIIMLLINTYEVKAQAQKKFVLYEVNVSKYNGYIQSKREQIEKEELEDAFLGSEVIVSKFNGQYGGAKYKFNIFGITFTLSNSMGGGPFTKYSDNEFRLYQMDWYDKELSYAISSFTLNIIENNDILGKTLITLKGKVVANK